MKSKLISIVFLFFLSIYSCEKDAVPEPANHPFIILSEVKDINSEGATFVANITDLGTQKIVDYGFVWDFSSSKPTINAQIKSFGYNPSLGEFSYRVNDGLEEGKVFSVRAYIITERLTVYSNTRSFLSE